MHDVDMNHGNSKRFESRDGVRHHRHGRDGFQLGNRGGAITLTDPAGRTVHSVT